LEKEKKVIKKILFILIIIVLIIAAALIIIKKKKAIENLEVRKISKVAVKTAKVRSGSLEPQIETIALIKAETSATVSSQVSGNIIKVFFNEGDKVRRGQQMAVIDPTIYNDAVESAKAKYEAAMKDFNKQKAIYERDVVLYQNGAISKQNLEISEAQFESSKANLVSAEKNLSSSKTLRNYCEVMAPYDGVVTARLVEVGDLATPGKPLYTIEIPGKVKVISKLSQESLRRISPNQKVIFISGDKKLETKTTRIYPALDNLHLGTVETELSQSPFELPSGATIKAIYNASPVEGIIVPSDAILKKEKGALVFKVKDGKSIPVNVEIIAEGAEETAVKGEISVNDKVIVGMQSELVSFSASTEIEELENKK
jgi:RND family efflux transporter MFP subunit